MSDKEVGKNFKPLLTLTKIKTNRGGVYYVSPYKILFIVIVFFFALFLFHILTFNLLEIGFHGLLGFVFYMVIQIS
jgi:hypothetical protein